MRHCLFSISHGSSETPMVMIWPRHPRPEEEVASATPGPSGASAGGLSRSGPGRAAQQRLGRQGCGDRFLVFESLAGWRDVKVAETRQRGDLVHFMCELVDDRYKGRRSAGAGTPRRWMEGPEERRRREGRSAIRDRRRARGSSGRPTRQSTGDRPPGPILRARLWANSKKEISIRVLTHDVIRLAAA